MPKQKFPKLEAVEFSRATVINKNTNDWIQANCDSKGNQLNNNTSKAIRDAIKSLKTRTNGYFMLAPSTVDKLAVISLDFEYLFLKY